MVVTGALFVVYNFWFLRISKMFGVISKITGSGQGGCCLAFLRKMMDSKRKKEFIQVKIF